MNNKVIHIKDAIALLESKQEVNISVWKLSTGDIIEYNNVVCVGGHWRSGTHRIRIQSSGLVREFRDIALFKINGMEIYL